MNAHQEEQLAAANEELLHAGLMTCRKHADAMFAAGKTVDEVNASLKVYLHEQLEPWRVAAYRRIRRAIMAPAAPSVELQ